MLKNISQALCASIIAVSGAIAPSASADDGTKDVEHNYEFEHVSCKGDENEIRVVVSGVKKSIGRITADLYNNDEEGFLKRSGRAVQVKFAAKAPETQFCIRAPQSGDYAIAVYHDRNANNTFDKTALGLPGEPWGLSQNPRIRFSAPKVGQTLFSVPEDGANVHIKLN
ncbi:MAG: DUF2141 domain-containing protein [Pseudomonadota bacterium]